MSESKVSKFIWLVIGGVVGGAISLSYKTVIEPLLAPKPSIAFSASSNEATKARFTISNTGNAVSEDVSVSIWATAPFAARTDIIDVEHAGGETDASCEFGLYQAKMTGMQSSIPTSLNTEAQAVLVRCDRIRAGERWTGAITYEGPEAVFGLMAIVKDQEKNENMYGRFSDAE